MKQHYEIINKLQSTDSRLEKENIIREEANNDNQIFFKGLRYALDSTITFGVKKVPSHGGPDGQGLPWSVFEALLQQLQTRELTGNDAKSAIEFVMSASKKIEWNNWYRLILIKDLKSGLRETLAWGQRSMCRIHPPR